MLGYAYGVHAPGRRDFAAAMHAVHHLLLGHGLATQRMREAAGDQPDRVRHHAEPGHGDPGDRQRRRPRRGPPRRRRWAPGIYLDPLVHGRYPADVVADLAAAGHRRCPSRTATSRSSRPRSTCSASTTTSAQSFSGVDEDGNDRATPTAARSARRRPDRPPITAMGWEIVPEGFTELLVRLSRDYPGCRSSSPRTAPPSTTSPTTTGFVRDDDRVAYLAVHIARGRRGPRSRAPTSAATSPGR